MNDQLLVVNGAALSGLDEFQEHLQHALQFGMNQQNAEKYAYEKTAVANGYYV